MNCPAYVGFRQAASGVVCAVAFTICASPEVAFAKEEYLLRLGHDTIDDYQDSLSQHFGEELEKLTDGRIRVEIYPANQLGSNESMNQQVRTGSLQGMIQPTAFLTPVAPVLGLLDLPFLFPSHEVQNIVLNSDAAEPLNEALRDKGYMPVAWMTGGFKQFNSTFPIRSAEDFQGRVYRTMTSPILVRQYEAWGATPTTMSFSEVYTGLQQGTIEGQENPPDATYHMKMHEVAKYLTISNHGALTTVLTVSLAWYDRLPADLQEAVRQAGLSTSEVSQGLLEPYHTEAIEGMRDAGADVSELAEKERQKLRTLSEPVWDIAREDSVMGPALEKLVAEVESVTSENAE